ncbi:MAG TPA: 3-deoxy-7-phosphoheptulonate synthase [Clostridiales bacterium]|nr:MAG: 3-deoxy-7-phosphoheptulonate synthase [Clostridiales bacterium GWD2_32_59]HAN09880.1 3-deoxy-7-phosphoheptulonate synthase [Clostridiales bacterium]
MSFDIIRMLPTPEEIASEIPLTKELNELKAKKDKEIVDIITGVSNKFLLIIGPCSADNEDSVCDYINRLAKVQEKVSDKIFIVPRIYTNKPRTNGLGYKGMLHQPDPAEDENILSGIKQIRNMHIRVMRESHLTGADEMLYPENYEYAKDLVSYHAVGARSTENQQHRLVASGIDIAVGMKNPMCGDISVMLNSIKAAQSSHTFIYNREETLTSGNPLAHGILRGAVDHYGRNISNYHYEDVLDTAQKYIETGLLNPTLIIDTNHSNSGKKYFEQPRIAMEIIKKRKYSDILKNMVKGLMIESYIEEGTQKVSDGVYGKSITDPCLGWVDTEKLIMKMAEKL